MSIIVPQSLNSGIPNVLVSIHTISETYAYPRVVKRHIRNTLDWFFETDEYSTQELLRGFKRELYILENDTALICTGTYNHYSNAIRIAEIL